MFFFLFVLCAFCSLVFGYCVQVSNYIQQEEEMFSLYNFIQTVNTEIDTVIEATQQTETEIKKFRGLCYNTVKHFSFAYIMSIFVILVQNELFLSFV